MSELRFLYRSPDGQESSRCLVHWTEAGHYVKGIDKSLGRFRTFRKDRIVEYLDGVAAQLSNPYPPPPSRVETTLQILFTGFAAAHREHLESLAKKGGLKVVKGVTKRLAFLCAGPNAGPAKVRKAMQQCAYIMREPAFYALLETGELPDHFIDDLQRERIPSVYIAFTDARNGVSGFAKDWYFWVPGEFKPALDIAYSEYIDEEKTLALRNKRSYELFGCSHDELKKRIEASYDEQKKQSEAAGEKPGKKLSLLDSEEHRQIMSYAIRYLLETQGEPPLYGFRETDSLESKSGEWYVQVEQAVADTEERQGNVGFRLYAKNRNRQACEGVWAAETWFSTSQSDFVELLRTGRCSVIDLAHSKGNSQ
ncbi:MAG: hypothetical protein FWD62_01690 [Betaproteobacteria bacterium]|nr:hypothetical protein [Betaproteobacteria bacterium]